MTVTCKHRWLLEPDKNIGARALLAVRSGAHAYGRDYLGRALHRRATTPAPLHGRRKWAEGRGEADTDALTALVECLRWYLPLRQCGPQNRRRRAERASGAG